MIFSILYVGKRQFYYFCLTQHILQFIWSFFLDFQLDWLEKFLDNKVHLENISTNAYKERTPTLDAFGTLPQVGDTDEMESSNR